MHRTLASLLAASLLLGSSAARADDAPSTDPPKATHWYGYQTLATDGAALALAIPAMATSNSSPSMGFGIASTAMYGLGAPIVHLTHGHVGKGLLDLGLRVAMPIALGFVGAGIGVASYHPQACNASTDASCGLGNAFGPAFGARVGRSEDIAVDVVSPVDLEFPGFMQESRRETRITERPKVDPSSGVEFLDAVQGHLPTLLDGEFATALKG